MRELIERARDFLEKKYSPGQILLVEAPTGYGKSVSAPILAAELYERGYAFNFIHVLPLRAIVTDLYTRTYVEAFRPCVEERLKPVREAFEKMGLREEDVAYQMGVDALLKEKGGRKSPSFDARAVVSTLDSFAYSLLRLPVSESFKATKHYAQVRARIFTSAVFMDEAHIVLRYPEEEDAGRMLAFMKVLVEYAQRAETPLVVMSATIGSWFKSKLKEWAGSSLKTLSLGKKDAARGSEVLVRDPDYEDEVKSIEWVTELIEERELPDMAVKLAECGLKVLIVRNRVGKAVETYESIEKRVKCVLLHGQLTSEDRDRALKEINQLLKSEEGFVAVATPVVEAGVNWNFDAAFVEAANAFSMVQVVGRVCRNARNCEGLVYVVKSEEARRELVEWLGKVLSQGCRIDWRLPFDYDGDGRRIYGYQNLIELMNKSLERLSEDKLAYDTYRILALAPFPPSRYVSEIEKSMEYSVLREPLTQVFVGFPDTGDPLARAVSYDLSLARKLQERNYVIGFICVGVDEGGQVVVEKCEQPPPPEAGEYVRSYRSCMRRFVEGRDVHPVAAGYVVKEEAYERGVGFRV